MLTSFGRHFFRAIRHVKAVILMLVALMVAVLVYAVRESIEKSRTQDLDIHLIGFAKTAAHHL